MSHTAPDAAEYAALNRLLRLAVNDTPAARCASDFLLAWWNARDCGGFDFSTLASLSRAQLDDVLIVTAYLARAGHGPEVLGLTPELEQIVRLWRPHLLEG